jgi:alkanesulfonate monooxygenase SsuD/methylene tetrahydromethanopterin reductase-like flavin-dependent oxidoreductase (luciferase family)
VTTSVPLGVGLPPLETRRDVVLHVATRAEELGYTGFYLAEGWGHDAGVLLAEVAARTDRIQIGTGVLNVWGRSPASIAMLAASLDEVSGGRFALGLGAGSPQLAEGLHDVPFDAPIERLGAVVRQVRRLLAGERMVPAAAAPGRALRLAVRPPAEIPINLAGLGPRSVRLSGELADGWYPFLLPRSALDESARMLAEGAARRGPGRSVPRICPGLPMAVAPDHAAARAVASWWVVFYLTSMGPLYRDTLRRLGFGAAVDDVLAANTDRGSAEVPASADVLLDELTICGDAAAARAGLQRWYAAGADMPVIVLPPNRATDELDYVLEAMRPVDEFRGSLGSYQ